MVDTCPRRTLLKEFIVEVLFENHPGRINFILTLSTLPDPRDNRGKSHSLVFVIVAVVLALLAGRATMSGIHRYFVNKIDWLRCVTGIHQARPISRAHLPRLLHQIPWQALDEHINHFFNRPLILNSSKPRWTALDGKVLRGSSKSGEKQAIVHAIAHDDQSELAQARQSGTKASEIPVVRQLLRDSGLAAQKVTFDAHHCNPETLTQVASAQGTYLTQVKQNQPILLGQCQQLAVTEGALFDYSHHEKAHGRLTSRYATFYPMQNLSLDARWEPADLQTLIVIRRETLQIKAGKTTEETSYYVTNEKLTPEGHETAEELVQAIRKHWSVEANNWILDVTFQEDSVRAKVPNQACIMARLRSMALGLLRQAGETNFQAALEKFADKPASMFTMLRQVNFL